MERERERKKEESMLDGRSWMERVGWRKESKELRKEDEEKVENGSGDRHKSLEAWEKWLTEK